MFVMDYTAGKGWHDPRIVPYAPLQLDPAAIVLHYAQESFEGMKAYRTQSGSIQLFRPEKNAARFKSTHERICMPPVPESDFVEAVKALVKTEKDWVPSQPGESLYIRPFCIATEPHLGVKPSDTYQFIIICCPGRCLLSHGPQPGQNLC